MSRKVYTMEVNAMVTIMVSETYEVEAEDLEVAKMKAREQFSEMLDETYAWQDCDEINVDYTEVAEYER